MSEKYMCPLATCWWVDSENVFGNASWLLVHLSIYHLSRNQMICGFVWKSPGTLDKFTSCTDVSLTFGWRQVSVYQSYCYDLIRPDTQADKDSTLLGFPKWQPSVFELVCPPFDRQSFFRKLIRSCQRKNRCRL